MKIPNVIRCRAPRLEVFDLLEHSPKSVLDVGCGAGGTGALIKQKYGAFVAGIERDTASAKIAKTRLDIVHQCDIESSDLSVVLVPQSIDTLITGDILEHLYEPWSFLTRIKPYLTSNAQVIASIPNVRNAWLLQELITGRWTYKDSGLLDITHIRFFTRNEVKNLFSSAGYRIEIIKNMFDSRVQNFDLNTPTDIDMGKFILKNVTQQDWDDYRTLQFLIRATPVW